MRGVRVAHTDPPDFHGHAPDVTTQRFGRGGNASLGIPGSQSINRRSAIKVSKGSGGRKRGKKRH